MFHSSNGFPVKPSAFPLLPRHRSGRHRETGGTGSNAG